jgi:magnesium transporter
VHAFVYEQTSCREVSIEDEDELRACIESESKVWIDVQGFGDESRLRAIASLFGLSPLTLEDATNVPQRAKSEPYKNYHSVVARLPMRSDEDKLEVPQVSLILGPDWLLTFQDRYFGFFDIVRRRLHEGAGPIRRLGSGYLLYALLDTLVDHYFPVVEDLAADLENLEEEIMLGADSSVLQSLHAIRRDLVVIRRVGWPQREALRALVLSRGSFITDDEMVYMRHTENHLSQAMEAVDAAREATTGLVEIHLSNVSQGTNEVMKVLTLLSSIFIPLTFIAGIYGMNFEFMPELRQRWAYPVVLCTMVASALGMLAFFRRRGWLGGRPSKDEARD